MSELPDRHKSAQAPFDRVPASTPRYRIIRKGSRYNITGPDGRVFNKYKSASIAGPRWEELTHTPWPHKSSAYESGLRLWELGIISRDQIGKTTLAPKLATAPSAAKSRALEATSKQTRRKSQAKATTQAGPARQPDRTAPSSQAEPARQATDAQPTEPGSSAQTKPVTRVQTQQAHADITLHMPPALPAPAFDLARQQRLIAALRRNPRLLFNADVQDALRREVEYHRPYARWASNLLKLLARYHARQRSQTPLPQAKQKTILARHIAWQEQRLRETAAST